MRLAVKGSH